MDNNPHAVTFFVEAFELLEEMEKHLLDINPEAPDSDQLNAIFRAAHSIKGGAGIFSFETLQNSTHIIESTLDLIRKGYVALTTQHIDLFLRSKDMLSEQLQAYRAGEDPNPGDYSVLIDQIKDSSTWGGSQGAGETVAAPGEANTSHSILVTGVSESGVAALVEALNLLGSITSSEYENDKFKAVLSSPSPPDEIESVLCFIVNEDQVTVTPSYTPPAPASVEARQPASAPQMSAIAATAKEPSPETATLRVPVSKVDLIINLVGELVITQSMLEQTAGQATTQNAALINGLGQLQRNARDLQESVMSIRMVQMDYVFSRFPRQVRDLAGKLNKKVQLVTEGKATELDKSLVEKIIDPLSHLVRNSLDHGIETPDVRIKAGKSEVGTLTLAARHQGGSIVIDVTDDGGGLNREKIISKAKSNGIPISDQITDDEVYQLIFAPGFSTADTVSDVSGRGVGMDVVKRNIQSLGGTVKIFSNQGKGTTTRIILPLTLAILDGMSVKAGGEVFIIPLSAVVESLQPRPENIYVIANSDHALKVRDEYFSIVPLAKLFGFEPQTTDIASSVIVIVQAEGRRFALVVDDLVGQQQVVVKNLETNYRKVDGVSAATIMGDGSVSLILDVSELQQLKAKLNAGDSNV